MARRRESQELIDAAPAPTPQQPMAAVGAQSTPPVMKRGWRKMTWFILIVNVSFLAWVIAGIASDKTGTDCGSLDQATCDAAVGTGAAIGIGLIFVFWAIVDVILLVLWLITRPRQR